MLPPLLLLLLLPLALLLPVPAQALPRGGLEVGSQLQMLEDPEARLDRQQALQAHFQPVHGPQGNFGPRQGALWLKLELPAAAQPRRWVLEIDYPPLQQVEAWLLQGDGRQAVVLAQARMGSAVPADQRPLRSRAHAWPLELPAEASTLLLRVQSSTTLAVPLRLYEADRYVEAESFRLLLQGLMFGVSLLLLVGSLVNGLVLRDTLFLWYALMILGISALFLNFSGLGHQFLWEEQTGLAERLAPLGALLGGCAGSLFACSALSLRQRRPRVARVLFGVAALGLTLLLASVLGLLSYRQTSLIATLLGPIPTLIALVESVRVAWHERGAGRLLGIYVAAGWALYAAGSLAMALLLRGRIGVDFWTLHALQFASLLEMFVWMRVLSLRIQGLRLEAERSEKEKRALLSLAQTDALTGLPNRRGLDAALQRALAQGELALFLIDLDGFKAVNDQHGHEVGDALLQTVAQRLRRQLRSSDLVARLGGDEFVVISPGLGQEDMALRLGQKLVEAFARPISVKGRSCPIGLSVGLAIAPRDGSDAATLLRHADAAMYAAKQGGKGRVMR